MNGTGAPDNAPPPRDMLDVILLGKKRANESWIAALEKQLCYELKTFLLAGHETSASMLTLTLLEVLSSPDMENRILQEAAAVLGPANSDKVSFALLVGPARSV
jgi:cytochrome P450